MADMPKMQEHFLAMLMKFSKAACLALRLRRVIQE
jgi:hypothetical protein